MENSKLWTRKTRIVSQDRRFKMLRVFMTDPPPAFRKGWFLFRIRDTLFPPHALLHFKSPKKPHNLAKSSGASTVSPQKKKIALPIHKTAPSLYMSPVQCKSKFWTRAPKKKWEHKKSKLPTRVLFGGLREKTFASSRNEFFGNWMRRSLMNGKEYRPSWRISLRRRLKQPLEKHPLPQRKQNVFQSLLWSSLCGSLLGWSILLLCVFKSYFV